VCSSAVSLKPAPLAANSRSWEPLFSGLLLQPGHGAVCAPVSQLLGSQSASASHVPYVLQLFEYILEYLRTVRFGEPDHSLALPADQTELAQIVREVNTCVPCSSSYDINIAASMLGSAAYFWRSCVCCPCSEQLPHAAVACTLLHVIAVQALQLCMSQFWTTRFFMVSCSIVSSACAAG